MTPARPRSSAETTLCDPEPTIHTCATTVVRVLCALLIAAGGLGGCGSCQTAPGDPLGLVPADADGVMVVPSVDRLRAGAHALLAGVEGGAGVFDLLTARFGVDLTTDEGFSAAGVHSAGSAVCFTYEEATVLAVGVTDRARFEAAVARQVHKKMGGRPVQVRLEGVAGAAESAERDTYDWPMWRVTWGTTPDAVGWVVYTGGDADPQTLLKEMGRAERGFFARDAAVAARELAGDDALAWAAGRFVWPLPRALGLARLAIRPALRRLSDWRIAVWMDGDRVRVEADVRWRGKGPMPVAWARPEGPPIALHDLVPRQVTGVLRARVDPGALDRLPRAVRKRLPTHLPVSNGDLLPSLRTLMDLLQGDLALVALGVDEAGTLDDLRRTGFGLDGALQLMHGAVVARLRDPARAAATLDETRRALEGVGWVTSDVGGGGWRGCAFGKGASSYTVLLRDDVAVLLSGQGEADRWLAVGAGQALALGSLSESPMLSAALGGEGASTMGAVANFARLTRELAGKGVPPYFLKMLADIRAVTATIDLSEAGAVLALEVRL